MLVFKVKEQVAKKERELGRTMTMEEIADAVGVSRITMAKIAGPLYCSTNTDNIDRLCNYFGCDIADIVEYRPDVKQASKWLTERDLKLGKKIIPKMIEYIKINAATLGLITIPFRIILNDSSRSDEIYWIDDQGNTSVNIIKPSINTMNLAYVRYLTECYSYCSRINVLTASSTVPTFFRQGGPTIDYYHVAVLYNEMEETIIDMQTKIIK